MTGLDCPAWHILTAEERKQHVLFMGIHLAHFLKEGHTLALETVKTMPLMLMIATTGMPKQMYER